MVQEILTNRKSRKIDHPSTSDGSVVGLPSSGSSSEDEEDMQAQATKVLPKETPSWESISPKPPKPKQAEGPSFHPGDEKQPNATSNQAEDDEDDDDVVVVVGDGDKQDDREIEPPRAPPPTAPPAMETSPEEAETIIPPAYENSDNDNHTAPAPIVLEMNGSTRVTNDISLEERVQELETKLATLSRILHQQQRLSAKNLLVRSPSNSQRNLSLQQQKPRVPGIPRLEDLEFPNNNNPSEHHEPDEERSPVIPRTHQKGMVPYLESPAPMEDPSPRQRSLHQRKRLSFHLLYDGNEDNLDRADDDEHVVVSIMAQKMDESNQTSANNSFHTDTGEGHPLHNNNNNNSSHNPIGTTTSHGSEFMTTRDNGTQPARQSATKNSSSVAAKEAMAARGIGFSQSIAESWGDSSHQNSVESGATEEFSSGTPSRFKAAILPPMLLSKDKRSKWLDHLNSFQESNHDIDIQMQEFIKVPGAVEKTLTSGFLICVDSFLYVCTILPIRFAWSLVLLSLHYFFKWTKKPAGKLQFHRRHTYQLIQVSIILFIYTYILLPISIGKLYHWIRGQAMIKLYVLIAIVEVFDRLMCSLGQDCLDSMYWNTTRRPRSARMVISVSVVIVYTAVHSLILFIHVCTLSVAMNSADEALLALLIAGNFAEIKSTVFKKYNKPSLFKIVASDICERFKLALFLGLVLLLNFCQGMDSRKMSDYQRIAGLVWMSELLCDWLKHAFITKFNFIPSTVYPEYGLLLAGDVTGIGHEGVNLDHSHAVVKRIGFAQMPLVCVMARLVTEAAKYASMRIDSNGVPSFVVVLAALLSWGVLLVLKTCLGAYLQRTSLAKLHAAPELSQTPLKSKQKQT